MPHGLYTQLAERSGMINTEIPRKLNGRTMLRERTGVRTASATVQVVRISESSESGLGLVKRFGGPSCRFATGAIFGWPAA